MESSDNNKNPINHDKKIRMDYRMNLHPNSARLQKEGDEESWISGEELQTDGSSDEDQSIKLKKQLQQSNKYEKNLDRTIKERNLKRQQSVATFNRIKMKSINSVDNNNKQSSDSLTESLNLENRWRPKRGSLKLPSLRDGGTSTDL